MCLTDNNFKNLPTGDVVDKLISEWGKAEVLGTTDQDGLLELSLFHGDYKIQINHPSKKNYSIHHMQVLPKEDSNKTTQLIQLFV